MKKLISKMKLFHLILLSLAGLVILSALPFKTQYSNIYVNVDTTLEKSGKSDINGSLGTDQTYLYEFFEYDGVSKEKNSAGLKDFTDNDGNVFGYDFNNYKGTVYYFENDLNALNTYLLWFGIVSIIGVAILYIFGNNNRRIYYKSNLLANGLVTVVILTMGIIFFINSFSMMGRFSQDSNLYNYVSVLQNPDIQIDIFKAGALNGDLDFVKSHFDCNVTTFIVYDLFIALFMAYTIFIFILTVVKYKATAERRKELAKVVAVND